MKQWWQRFGKKERLQMLLIGLVALVLLYGFVIYPVTAKALHHTENRLKRQLHRIGSRTELGVKGGGNPVSIQKQLNAAEKALKQKQAQLIKLTNNFVDESSAFAQQGMVVEINALARQKNIEVLNIERRNNAANVQQAKSGNKSPSGGYGVPRPTVHMEAYANYWQLLAFLEGLGDLSYTASVMWIEIRSRQALGQKDIETVPLDALALSVVIAI